MFADSSLLSAPLTLAWAAYLAFVTAFVVPVLLFLCGRIVRASLRILRITREIEAMSRQLAEEAAAAGQVPVA